VYSGRARCIQVDIAREFFLIIECIEVCIDLEPRKEKVPLVFLGAGCVSTHSDRRYVDGGWEVQTSKRVQMSVTGIKHNQRGIRNHAWLFIR
jgi:hypothetical protein